MSNEQSADFNSSLELLNAYSDARADDKLRRSVIAAVDSAVKNLIRWSRLPDGIQVAFVKDAAPETNKIAGDVLSKFDEIFLTPKYIPLIRALERNTYAAPTPEPVLEPAHRPEGEAVIFYAGDVVLARRMHWRVNEVRQFGNIPAMRDADLRVVNLESVVATVGEQGVNKGEGGPYYYHARPEQTNLLTRAHIDVVLTANNHAGDYGPDALIEQRSYLDRAGIIHVGSGKNLDEASRPVFVKVNGLVIAIFAVDTITKQFAATDDRAGTWYIPINKPELWLESFTDRIAEARKHADLIFVAPHWGICWIDKPTEDQRHIGRLLIDCGADAVLGTHSHVLYGIEKYNERPIIYDCGNFLFEEAGGRERDCGGFSLTIDRNGVRRVHFTPLRNGCGYVVPATRSRDRINNSYGEMCRELGTEMTPASDGNLELNLDPLPRGARPSIDSDASLIIDPSTLEHHIIDPLVEPRPEWIAGQVPEHAVIRPVHFGSLKLLGYYIPPECRVMTERRMLYVETWWTIDEPVDNDCRLYITAAPVRECRMPTWGTLMDHDFLDWMFPPKRWTPGVIYREKFGLRPPQQKQLANVDLRLEIRVVVDGKPSEAFVAPQLITLKISKLPYYRTDFPDIIYQSEPGQCWNAEQLEAVTGGKWLVKPPEGWFINSMIKDMKYYDVVEHPTMLIVSSWAKHNFHQHGELKGSNIENHSVLVKEHMHLAGAMISQPVEGLPTNFPLLMVDDPVRASIELGFAARRRFQGKMIGVTGSSGKTTTCNMLSYVLEKEHAINKTYSTANILVAIPLIFANSKRDDAFSIIEISINAFNNRRGSITYDLPPDIAVVTSILAVHMLERDSIKEIARLKSRIFDGMSAGGYAILNRDMPFYEIFEERASRYKLNIITFGMHPDSTIRMEHMINGGTFTVGGRSYTLECLVPPEQLYDALAVVGVSIATGYSLDKTLEYLRTFQPVKGRGNLVETTFNGKHIRVIDSSYNANPLSMSGALKYLRTLETNDSSRVTILGDMAELGKDEINQHLSMAEPLLDCEPDRVLLVGALMKHLWSAIEGKVRGAWFPTYKELNAALDEWSREGDTVLVKSSNSTRLDRVVEQLTKVSQAPSTAARTSLNTPSALFDVRNVLPEGITVDLNGRMPEARLSPITCGGQLYVDAARAFNAMCDAAESEDVYINVTGAFVAYRSISEQQHVFKRRFTPLDHGVALRADAIRVEYEGRTWQLNEGKNFAAIPGTSSHGFGLAVDIQNEGVRSTRAWLNAHSAEFGFVREFDFEPWHFTYVKARESIPERVLEVESWAPPRTWSAIEVTVQSNCRWYGAAPSADWRCQGLLISRPLKSKRLAVIDQGTGVGISERLIRLIRRQCAGLICVRPEELAEYKVPLLVSTDINDTIARLTALFDR